MANKKMIMSVVASGVIASSFFASDKVSAASHTVKSGDSLWTIAQKYNTSVSSLKKINNLSGDIIYPKQVLQTDNNKTTQSTSNTKTNTKANTKTNTKTSSPSTNSSTTYIVKSGDSLWVIAQRNNTSVANLKKLNNLSGDTIFPKQVLKINNAKATKPKTEPTSKPKTETKPKTEPKPKTNTKTESTTTNKQPSSKTTYIVKSGDTLSGIAHSHGVSYSDLMKWNNLDTTLIFPGNKLIVEKGTSPKTSTSNKPPTPSEPVVSGSSSSDVDFDVNQLINIAYSMEGTVYKWGGETPSGFDCSGFIHYAYNNAGKSMGRMSSTGYFDQSYYVRSPKKGDLVFFENTYQAGISHLGIYLGNNQFISAESDGVKVNSLDNPYWSKHFHGIKRLF